MASEGGGEKRARVILMFVIARCPIGNPSNIRLHCSAPALA